jgi:NAD(P)H-flavin reductase
LAKGGCLSKGAGQAPADVPRPGPESGQDLEGEIVARRDFSAATYLLEIRHPLIARAAAAGQFVIAMLHERGERIPLTIADFDRQKGTITLVVQAVGGTTREMQRLCTVGAKLFSVAGPLGLPSRLGAKNVVCVGGGLGVAPIFPQVRAFKESGARVVGVAGFRTKDLVFWEDKFRAYCDAFIICTDDGSVGIKGRVTEGLEAALERYPDIDEVVAIGPPVMMKACAETTRPRGIKTTVSLNPIMVDGTGMCGGCRVKVGGRTMFACVDGPDFDAHKVDFDDLMNRLRRFAGAEKLASEKYANANRLAPESSPAPGRQDLGRQDRPATSG